MKVSLHINILSKGAVKFAPKTLMRIGIFGGAFDPIHKGHLALAEAALREFALSELFFIPARQAPLKASNSNPTPDDLRYRMVEESIKQNSRLKISDVEMKREGISYTIDTLKEFRKKFPPPNKLFLFVGGDWGSRLHEWKNIDEIFSLCQFVIAARPGFQKSGLPKEVQFLDFMPIDISATKIRKLIQKDEPVNAWIPSPALQTIQKYGLYKN